ncbi:NAD-dependent epimerase/dehydratase family protein [Spirillospora sp. NPDC048911]|uniref:NAD-dependent epimerase/dehydratase family protein n=1 Tax=Spirillospora sp. NPDC048911 TaxID=3364527 RepID=UPI00371835A0
MSLGTIVMTGAAGQVGTSLRESLYEDAGRLVLIDRAPMPAGRPGEELRQLEVTGPEDLIPVVEGADAIVHLAGVPDEAPLADLLTGNVLGTQHVLEAARRTGVRRVVLASSNRLTGCYPTAETVSPEMPPRPDGLYGVTKVAVEALGRLYVDKFGLEVVCLRIGSFEAEPTEARHLATWLSPRDCAGFVRAALTVETDFLVAYAVSANTQRFWELSDELGYVPQDDAETRAAEITGTFAIGQRPQGGEFAAPGYTLEHGRLPAV